MATFRRAGAGDAVSTPMRRPPAKPRSVAASRKYMDQRVLRLSVIIVATLVFSATSPLPGQTGAKNGEWRTYGGDLGNTKYSPLDQINASNFNTLKLAWRFHTENLGPKPEYNMEDTPLMVGGVVYTTAGARRGVVALDAATGELLWV